MTEDDQVGAMAVGAPPPGAEARSKAGPRAKPRSKKSLRLTKTGHLAIAVTIALLACALNTGTNLLYLLTGGILGAILVNLGLVLGALRDLEVRRSAPGVAIQGVPFFVRYVLESRSGAPLPFPIGLEEAPLPTWRLPSGPVRAVYEGRGERRREGAATDWIAECSVELARLGRNALPPVRLVARGPFGFFEETRLIDLSQEVLVLPPCRPLGAGVLPALNTGAGVVARGRGMGEERRDALRSLRELRPGDDQRAIHWRSSARRGELVVKEFERATPSQVWLVVELHGAARAIRWDEGALDAAPPPDVIAAERALVLAASCAAGLIARGASVGLALAGGPRPIVLAPQPGRAALVRIQRALASAGPVPEPPLEAVWRRVARASQAILITSREPNCDRPLPPGLAARPHLSGAERGHYRLPQRRRPDPLEAAS